MMYLFITAAKRIARLGCHVADKGVSRDQQNMVNQWHRSWFWIWFFIAKYVSRQVLQQNRVADKSVDLKGYAFEFFPADAFITFGDNPIQILIRVSEICMCGL